MLPDLRQQRRAPDDDAGLRPSQQLVAAEAHDIDTRTDALLNRRLVRQRRNVCSGRCGEKPLPRSSITGSEKRRPRADELCQRRPFDETFNPEVRRVHAQDGAGRLADGQRVVGHARPVRGAYFAQPRARLRHHVRHAEAAANLDQLRPRHHHLASPCQRGERQQHGRRAVVHDDRRFCSREAAEQPFGMGVARAPPARRPRRIRDWCSRRPDGGCGRALPHRGERARGSCG